MTIQSEQLRRITGTVVAAILGQSEWMSAFEAQQKILGNSPDIPETDPMRHGLILEKPGGFLDQEAENYYGVMPEVANELTVHPTHDFLGAHMDRILNVEKQDGGECFTAPEILEYKCSGNPGMWGPSLSQEIPNSYYWQIVHQMLCLPQAPRVHLQAFLGVGDIRHYRLEREALQTSLDVLEPMLVNWYQRHIVEEVPIDPNTPAEAVMAWPKETANLKPLDQAAKDNLRILHNLKQSISQMEEQYEATKLVMEKDLKGHEGYSGKDGKPLVRWKEKKGSAHLDKKAFKAAHPEVYKEFCVDGKPFRPFTPEWHGIRRMFGDKVK